MGKDGGSLQDRIAILLAILLGEQETTETLERKDTQIFMDDGKVLQEVETTHTYPS